ncbi:hypothetical protein BJV77DRAFT_1025037 [Russula vinacea]|nr:hypothetical protein BJV77DRAFT_1025037 [Russula vinacea]
MRLGRHTRGRHPVTSLPGSVYTARYTVTVPSSDPSYTALSSHFSCPQSALPHTAVSVVLVWTRTRTFGHLPRGSIPGSPGLGTGLSVRNSANAVLSTQVRGWYRVSGGWDYRYSQGKRDKWKECTVCLQLPQPTTRNVLRQHAPHALVGPRTPAPDGVFDDTVAPARNPFPFLRIAEHARL